MFVHLLTYVSPHPFLGGHHLYMYFHVSVRLSFRVSIQEPILTVRPLPLQYICEYIIYEMLVPPLCICYVYYKCPSPPHVFVIHLLLKS